MNILDIIEKKKQGHELDRAEIDYFIDGYLNDSIKDYQAAALIMAICINGMTQSEILNLTISMANSGDVLDLSEISDTIVDKHSTGGVGDKVTLVLLPIIAACGVPVAKMSGRGLGITGGTIDKLESIPGYRTEISIEEFKENVKDIGISLIAQTLNLAPADKKIYALRDVISCANSIPLIASSIMSKKIAAGANKIVLDVTCGHGAFMKDRKEAEKLARMMKLIGEWAKRETICLITNMDEPLGSAVGNSLEVVEAIKCLNGEMAEDVEEVVLSLAINMMKLAGVGRDLTANKLKCLEVIKNGKALEKLKELVAKQGGDTSYIDNPEKYQYPVDQIIGHGGMDVADLLRLSASARYAVIKKMMQYCSDNNVTEFYELMDYAMEEHYEDWFPLLCDNSAYIVGQYIKSIRARVRRDLDD